MNRYLQQIESILGESVVSSGVLGGGCIADSRKIVTASGRQFFLKSGYSGKMFPCEANGLREIAKAGVIRVPEVVAADSDFLLLEYLERGNKKPGFFEEFGRSFAHMHRHTAPQFGFYEDNFIGATPQVNLPEGEEAADWTAFYFNKRLLFQYRLAERNGYATDALRQGFVRLEKTIRHILKDSSEKPGLLHGDLWGGNYLCTAQGDPALIDPAVYYGHREADLAMTRLFGGFSPSFYEAYQQEYPLPEGWEHREDIYKLYHLMNHLNLFGRGYLGDVERILDGYSRKFDP